MVSKNNMNSESCKTKVCKRCKIEKDNSEYYKSRKTYCKVCIRKENNARYVKNRIKNKGRSLEEYRQFLKENKKSEEEVKQTRKQWYLANRDSSIRKMNFRRHKKTIQLFFIKKQLLEKYPDMVDMINKI